MTLLLLPALRRCLPVTAGTGPPRPAPPVPTRADARPRRARPSCSQTVRGTHRPRGRMSSRGTRSGVPRPAVRPPRRQAERRRPLPVRASLPARTARRGTRACHDARVAAFAEIVWETADLSGSAATSPRQTRRELAARANPELPVRAREVRLDGADTHEQLDGDLAVPPPRRSELRDPLLRLRQFARGVGTEADTRALRLDAVRE